eukprot:3688135-Rhodomonas_salina.1
MSWREFRCWVIKKSTDPVAETQGWRFRTVMSLTLSLVFPYHDVISICHYSFLWRFRMSLREELWYGDVTKVTDPWHSDVQQIVRLVVG